MCAAANLLEHSNLSVVKAVCDGASTNRLLIKANTSDGELGRGTPNHFVQSWCWNLVQPHRKLFFGSDAAHSVKKGRNNMEDRNGKKKLMLPEPFVRAIIDQVLMEPDLTPTGGQPPPADEQPAVLDGAAPPGGEPQVDEPPPAALDGEAECIESLVLRTAGEEAYIYLMGRQ